MLNGVDLSGWMAIVTGSGTGIGRAIALLPAMRAAAEKSHHLGISMYFW